MNLLSLNNDSTYHNSGGNGYTDELPTPGFDPDRVRLCDMWGSAEAQEMAQVSPEMHAEFVLQYEKRLLGPFALTGYGCCEDLTRKMDDVFTIPNIRRISIAPSADVAACAEISLWSAERLNRQPTVGRVLHGVRAHRRGGQAGDR